MSGDVNHVFNHLVSSDILEVISRPHTKEIPGVPFVWMVSYESAAALQNIKIFENGVRHCKLQFPIRVFLSKWTDAIVVSFVPLESIKEIHVMEWYCTFYEVDVDVAKHQLVQFPKFPYDGRNADLVRADLICNGGYQTLINESRRKYLLLGVKLPEHQNWQELYE